MLRILLEALYSRKAPIISQFYGYTCNEDTFAALASNEEKISIEQLDYAFLQPPKFKLKTKLKYAELFEEVTANAEPFLVPRAQAAVIGAFIDILAEAFPHFPLILPWRSIPEQILALLSLPPWTNPSYASRVLIDHPSRFDQTTRNLFESPMGLLSDEEFCTELCHLPNTYNWKSENCWSPVLTTQFLQETLSFGLLPLGVCVWGESNIKPGVLGYSRLPSSGNPGPCSDSLEPKGSSAPVVLTSPFLLEKPNYWYVFLPKANIRRSCIAPHHMLSNHNTRKRAKRFSFSINKAFERVVEGIHEQHGEAWIYRPLVRCMAPLVGSHDPQKASIVSVEVWQNEDELVAGELGVINGTCYTSMCGFAKVQSSGTVQLAALAGLLYRRGVEMWDLGMEMPYKLSMGAKPLPRRLFYLEFMKRRAMVRRVYSSPIVFAA